MARLETDGISVGVTPLGGMLERLTIERDGRRILPLHRAPWVGTNEEMPAEAAPHLAVLEGDFFCAPFGATDEPGVPAHGWPANGHWRQAEVARAADGALTGLWNLDERVRGASVTKQVTLRPGHPVVYQHHTFRGGRGAVPIAHHVMLRVPGGARLSFSSKDFGRTPPVGLETDPARGRGLLAYPQSFDGLDAVNLAEGGTLDVRSYPFAQQQEDFLTLYDPPTAVVGWSAVVAPADGFVFFAVKDAQMLPQTSLWISNGGRYYAPWSGRHTAVLGIEEGCSLFGNGRLASAASNELSARGYRTSVQLGGEIVVRYAFGAIPVPQGWREVAGLEIGDGALTLMEIDGGRERVPFDGRFLSR